MQLLLTVKPNGTTLMLDAIAGYPYVIGRYDDESDTIPDIDLTACDGVDLGVSRHHAVLLCEGDFCYLRDGGSANGTFVNGKRLTNTNADLLQSGDCIRVGRLMLHFQITLENLPAPSAAIRC